MNCAWQELLGILPHWMRQEIDHVGRQRLQELRLRINSPPELIGVHDSHAIERCVTADDLKYCINSSSKYSPWSAATVDKGYITAPGGHRIGICGQVLYTEDHKLRIQEITSLCIRVARDFPGIACAASLLSGSILILGAPGWGKTTLLRDLSRIISKNHTLCVVDERNELFPSGIERGNRMDVLGGVPKVLGIEMMLRTMGPAYIAADEITAQEDCNAILHAANCGVCLLATAHGTSVEDYLSRPVYKSLVTNKTFRTLLLLHKDKSFTIERVIL